VLDGCLHDMSLVPLEGLYGDDISTFKVYDFGYVKEQKWPIGYPVTYMKFGTQNQKYYLIVNNKIRQFENNNTVTKYGLNTTLAK
jgi:hypothetical protein